MSQQSNQNFLIILGKLALAKSMVEDSEYKLFNLLENSNLNRVSCGQTTLDILERTVENLRDSKGTLDDAIYGISTDWLKAMTIPDSEES